MHCSSRTLIIRQELLLSEIDFFLFSAIGELLIIEKPNDPAHEIGATFNLTFLSEIHLYKAVI